MTKNELGSIVGLYNKPIAERNAEKLRKKQGTGWTEKPGETWNSVVEVYYHDVTLRSFSLPEEKAEIMTVLKMVFNHDEKVIELLFFRDQYKWEFYKFFPGHGLDEIGWGLEPRKGFRSENVESLETDRYLLSMCYNIRGMDGFISWCDKNLEKTIDIGI